MLYVAIGLGLFFIGIGFVITSNNAKHLLSNYRSMSSEDQAAFGLDDYIKEFRSFHTFLGLTLILSGILINQFGRPNLLELLVGVYPILAYAYFIYKTKHFNSEREQNRIKYYVGLLGLIAVALTALFFYSMAGNDILFHEHSIEVTGMYGEDIQVNDIESLDLVAELPEIKLRVNGSSIGSNLVGSFKTSGGKRVKLFVDKSRPTFIRIETRNRGLIFYNSETTKTDFKLMKKAIEQK